MKTLIFRVTFIVCLISIQFSNFTFSQSQFSGKWEGKFMNDFKTILEINSDENNSLSGTIKMFSGSDIIQDDQLSNVDVNQNILTFRIHAKDTDFKGEFNSDENEITGVFIFPDKSEHPLKLTKKEMAELPQESSNDLYWKLKNKKYRVDELKEDFDFLVGQIKEIHPQLYQYTTSEKFDNLTNKIRKSINHELSIIEYFRLIAPVVESIKCSHTGIRLPSDFQNEIYSHENFLPLQLIFDGSRAFCVKNYSSSNSIIAPGVEILSINNNSIQDITEKLYLFIPSEGANKTTKNYMLNQNFNTYLNLIDNSDRFEIEFLKNGEKIKSSVNACSFSIINEQSKNGQNNLPVKFLIDNENNIGFLTFKSFMVADINAYIQQMDGIFNSLINEKITQLVLDLRGNSGGHPIFAAQLFSYLTNKNFIYFKRNNDVKEFEPLYISMQKNNLHYNGKVLVFVDGGCLSTTGHLISLLKYHTNAIFIGQEPGSTYRCNDFSVNETLPNTKIEVNIPRTTFETAVSDSFKSEPFSVDFKVNYSIENHLKGVDDYLSYMNHLPLKP